MSNFSLNRTWRPKVFIEVQYFCTGFVHKRTFEPTSNNSATFTALSCGRLRWQKSSLFEHVTIVRDDDKLSFCAHSRDSPKRHDTINDRASAGVSTRTSAGNRPTSSSVLIPAHRAIIYKSVTRKTLRNRAFLKCGEQQSSVFQGSAVNISAHAKKIKETLKYCLDALSSLLPKPRRASHSCSRTKCFEGQLPIFGVHDRDGL